MRSPFFLLLALCGALVACTKERSGTSLPGHPEMRYTNLQDVALRQGFRKVDLNGDGRDDLHFYVQLVGDPALQADKKQFNVRASIGSNLLVNEHDETPVLPLLEQVGAARPGFAWIEIGHAGLAEKVTAPVDTWWDGFWKSAQHRFLAVQVHQDNARFHGWVELSMDQSREQVVLHRAAISTVAGKPVRAGY